MEEVQNQAEQPVQAEVEQPQETQADRNWKLMRDQNQNYERRILELEQQQRVSQTAAPPPVPDQALAYTSYDDESFIDGKTARAQEKRFIEALAKQQRASDEQQKANKQWQDKMNQDRAEDRLNSKYKDFSKVVNDASLAKLAEKSPSSYRSIIANQNIYDRGDTAYEMITSYGIVKKEDAIDRKLEENALKPRTSTTAGPQASDTPLSRLGEYDRRILSDDDMKKIRKNSRLAQGL